MTRRPIATIALGAGLLLAACGSSDGSSDPDGSSEPAGSGALEERLDEIDGAVDDWRNADTLADAQRAAETAANLVVGPGGPDFGDRNGDGTVDGETTDGVLPGLDGTPEGLALPVASNECVEADVLGGSWADPMQRWATMNTAIDEWTRTNNTMPSLPSHPMRVVGWATFTMGTDDLGEAREYAGHARLHVDISLAALDC